ncbi:MAG: hypothetical protein MUF82_09125, partial [Bacteroidetes bacterium]|nr:hypothetical protein [Bacteroidota bacterium]
MNILPLLDVVPRDANLDARTADGAPGSADVAEPFLPLLVQIVAAGLLVPQMVQPETKLEANPGAMPEAFTPSLPFVPATGTEEQPLPIDNPSAALGAILQGRVGAGIRNSLISTAAKAEELLQKEVKAETNPALRLLTKTEPEQTKLPLFARTELAEPILAEAVEAEPTVELPRLDRDQEQAVPVLPEPEEQIALEGFKPVTPEEAQELESRLGLNTPARATKEQREMPDSPRPEVRANQVGAASQAGMLKQEGESRDADRSNTPQHAKTAPHLDAASLAGMKRQHVGQVFHVPESTGLAESRMPEALKNSVIDQIVNAVKVNLNERSPEIRIKLHPETLGEVVVRVSMDEGVMQAK